MSGLHDTIAAEATPRGHGGISVLRISGQGAIDIASKIVRARNPLQDSPSHTVHFGHVHDGGRQIDQVLVSVFRAPNSYTGEDVVEISCHGNPFIVSQILSLILRDARQADPGEFTQRAFLNDRIDLTGAEAVNDLIHAQTRQAQAVALEQLEGSLHHRIEALLQRITKIRMQMEIEIDLSDQDLADTDWNAIRSECALLVEELNELVRTGREGLILREGFKIALVGPPNVGKSSIFNAFLETERAIVTPHPGTTRDYLEEAVAVEGYLLRLYDTAGIRETPDEIEKIGIDRSEMMIRQSDRVLFITDSETIDDDSKRLDELIGARNLIRVINKSDLLTNHAIADFRSRGFIPCSALRKDGLRELKDRLLKDIRISPTELHSGILTNARQIAAASRAEKSLARALASIDDSVGAEFVAFDMKEASMALEEIVGRITSDDLLNRIFDDFCVGK